MARTRSLETMLSTKVKTTAELMSIALQAEREAIRRYSELALDMRTAGNQSAAALFERMVTEEQEHERLLQAWMATESIFADVDIGPIRWRDPQVSRTYDDDARDPHYSSAYKALAYAVHNEENAFRFYTHVAAQAGNEALRKYAETLAREELGHAALLRAERRLAYHTERSTSPTQLAPNPKSIRSEIELLATAIQVDRYLADAIDKIETDSRQLTDLSAQVRQQLQTNENTLNSRAPSNDSVAVAKISAILAQADSKGVSTEPTSSRLDRELRRLRSYCDRCFAFYDAIVETTTDEAVMRTAQTFSSCTLDRMTVLQQSIGQQLE